MVTFGPSRSTLIPGLLIAVTLSAFYKFRPLAFFCRRDFLNRLDRYRLKACSTTSFSLCIIYSLRFQQHLFGAPAAHLKGSAVMR